MCEFDYVRSGIILQCVEIYKNNKIINLLSLVCRHRIVLIKFTPNTCNKLLSLVIYHYLSGNIVLMKINY